MHSPPSAKFEDVTSFELTLISADDLRISRRLSRRPIKVHAEVHLDGYAVKKSDADVAGGTNPKWNFKVHFVTKDSTVRKIGENLTVRLYHKRSIGHTFIGEVEIPMRRLFDQWRNSEKAMTYPVGDPPGRLNISYDFHIAG